MRLASNPTVLAIGVLLGACGGSHKPVASSPATLTKVVAAGRPAASLPTSRAQPSKGQGAAPPGLSALREELKRAMTALGKAKPPAYHLAYTATYLESQSIDAEYGAIGGSAHHEGRMLDVDVRVGAPSYDSQHASRTVAPLGAHVIALPIDGADSLALRQAAWVETDRAYKDAAERFVSVKNQQEVKAEEEDKSPDFSQEQPTRYIGEPAAPLGLEVDAYKTRLRAVAAKFKGEKDIHDSHVTLSGQRRTRWVVNSEGSELQISERTYRVTLSANTQAADGMPLGLFKSFESFTPEGLPNDAAMMAAAGEIIQNLKALRKAPLAEPFTGPAILEGRAAGVFFHEVIGHRLEAHRLRNDSDGQTFGKKLEQPVMPTFLSLYDDPTIRKIGSTEVNGHYFFDDEGVPAQRASLVDHGTLKGFLLSRTPARGLVHSNGHGRRQEGRPLVSRQGNLVLEASETVPLATLRARVLEETKKQGQKYALRFVDIQGGFTDTSRYGTQGFKVMPTLVYRMYVDGRPDELIRGVDIVGTPLAMLQRIEAAGDDYGIFNGVCGAESGWVPVSATSPSLLLGQIETSLKDKGSTKPPVLEPPTIGVEAPEVSQ
jgi:TldD protein